MVQLSDEKKKKAAAEKRRETLARKKLLKQTAETTESQRAATECPQADGWRQTTLPALVRVPFDDMGALQTIAEDGESVENSPCISEAEDVEEVDFEKLKCLQIVSPEVSHDLRPTLRFGERQERRDIIDDSVVQSSKSHGRTEVLEVLEG